MGYTTTTVWILLAIVAVATIGTQAAYKHGHRKPVAKDPNGNTGFSGKDSPSLEIKCWRYCSGNTGNWCFTATFTESMDMAGVCPRQTKCDGRCTADDLEQECVTTC